MADAKHLYIGSGVAGAAWTANNFPLDQTTDQLEWIFYAREATTITRVGFRYGSRNLTPPTYIISLQGVDLTTGFPDGTIKGGGSPASLTFTPPADTSIDGLWQWKTLANPYTCAAGELLAIVLGYSSGTVNGTNFSSISYSDSLSLSNGADGIPYVIQNNAGVRAKQSTRALFGYSSATQVYGNVAQSAFTPATFASTSTPDEYAVAFVIPSGWTGTYQIEAIDWRIGTPAAARSALVQLYSGTTVLQTATFDSDVCSNSAGTRYSRLTFTDANLTNLIPGQVYRIGLQPAADTGGWAVTGITNPSNADWAGYSMGVNMYLSTRTDGGAWTDDLTTRLHAALILKDISAPSPGLVVAT